MIRIENTNVFGWESALFGMRNPMNSWAKMDSEITERERLVNLGENDLKLMKNLVKSGNDHAKFLRFITVSMDVTAPLYWWKEFDTYKIGTVANSCSTMHKIQAKQFTFDDFSYEKLFDSSKLQLKFTIDTMNHYRDLYNKSVAEKDQNKDYWWQMIQLLPSSYNQMRTVQVNYAVLRNMYFARKAHKLDEWREFCRWVENLPYFKEICIQQ